MMQIGIGHPGTIPGTPGSLILEWARRADAGPFSSLGSLDRLVFPNYDALITLTAAAAVTQRIRLMTTVLLAPLHPAGILAKQAASIDALSGGRLTLGLGIGGRPDDYNAAPASFSGRGKRFEQQLDTLYRAWSGQPLAEDIGPIGPPPVQEGGPEVLIGGNTPAAIARVGRWGSGYIMGGGGPDRVGDLRTQVESAWQAAGRTGKPRFVAGMYFGLGPDATERAGSYIRTYYAFMGPMAEHLVASLPTTPDAVKYTLQLFAEQGVDEVICWPCIAEIEQVDRLAEIVR
jgi:alkanesulfonate monooxygenase SsuD/methylene tetrahydromethanopterin reductase-like flavin-dependent oxidoreductase (luciferase family)